jgi:exodeoxyribonuclease V gamma subunit
VIRLHRSNRTEALAGMLARVLETPLRDPLARECIVVQRRGMERWLAMQLAERHGICAGVEFLFPRRFLRERLFAPLLGADAAGPEVFEPARLTWEIAALLPALTGEPSFAQVRGYLEHDPSPRRRLALARRIAEVFDDYALYRPELVRRWEAGAEPADWQAQLWRALIARRGALHGAALVERASEQLARADPDAARLPERVCVFGLSSLPPLYLSALRALAERREVHVFALAVARPGAKLHPLLASLGRTGREFHDQLEAHGAITVEESWSDPLAPAPSILRRLQADLLAPRAATEPFDAAPGDASLSVHVCHGAMREAEVVRDQVLDAFAADPSLGLHDVAILTPDVATYGPLLEAVFACQDAPQRLRLSIADRAPLQADALAQALDAAVGLVRGRMGAAEVMDLLGRECVRGRFELAGADLEVLRGWVERSGIRWGVDAEHRAREGQPRLAQNTWRRGLERLLLGWAAGQDARLGEVLSEPCASAGPIELLARFAGFCETLFTLRERLLEARPAGEWAGELALALERLVDSSTAEAAEQERRLRGVLERVSAAARASGFGDPVPLEAYWAEVRRALSETAHAPTHAFLSGAITVCELVPMRSLPFRVVAVLGLGDEAFPRRELRPDFDRLAREPVRGDPSRRDEDRELFLEALLCARDRLILAYPGRSPRDGAELPPSVVVDELLDVLGAGFRRDGQPLDRQRLPLVHPVHPFSPRYFSGEDPRLFSFDARAQRACAAAGPPVLPRPFLEGELPADPKPLLEVSLEELGSFLRHPARWFCQHRLGLSLGPLDGPLEEREPLELDALERWSIGSELLAARLGGGDPAHTLEAVRLRGELPPGQLGNWQGIHLLEEAEQRWQKALATGRGLAARAVEIDAPLGSVQIRGRLTGLDADGALVSIQFGRLERAREVPVWVRHVAANWALGPTRTWMFGAPAQDGGPSAVGFEPVSEPAVLLAEWLHWLEEGGRRPLPLYCEASRVYAARRLGGATAGEALASARSCFEREAHLPAPPGESSDPYVALVTRGREALDGEFEARSLALFEPLLQHRRDVA